MLRIIPIVLIKDGKVVLSRNFERFQSQGSPNHIIRRLAEWDCDEVIILDISRRNSGELSAKFNPSENFSIVLLETLQKCSNLCLTPISVGGGIRTRKQIENLLSSGADRVILNSTLNSDLEFCMNMIEQFGGSTIIGSVDYKIVDGESIVFTENGGTSTKSNLIEYCLRLDELGISEFLLNSIDRDGKSKGFDKATIMSAVSSLRTPVIACGGAGAPEHFEEILGIKGLSAVAAANFFYFRENSMPFLKSHLIQRGLPVRSYKLSELPLSRNR